MSAIAERKLTHAKPASDKGVARLLDDFVGLLLDMTKVPQDRLRQELAPARAKTALKHLDLVRELFAVAAPAAAARRQVEAPKVTNELPGLLDQGLVLPAAEFAEKLDWTRQALSKALQANRVFFLESGGDRFYPAFYLDKRYERRHLEAVSRILGDLSGGSKWLFFTAPKASLSGSSPLQALKQGRLQLVRTAAEGYAER